LGNGYMIVEARIYSVPFCFHIKEETSPEKGQIGRANGAPVPLPALLFSHYRDIFTSASSFHFAFEF